VTTEDNLLFTGFDTNAEIELPRCQRWRVRRRRRIHAAPATFKRKNSL